MKTPNLKYALATIGLSMSVAACGNTHQLTPTAKSQTAPVSHDLKTMTDNQIVARMGITYDTSDFHAIQDELIGNRKWKKDKYLAIINSNIKSEKAIQDQYVMAFAADPFADLSMDDQTRAAESLTRARLVVLKSIRDELTPADAKKAKEHSKRVEVSQIGIDGWKYPDLRNYFGYVTDFYDMQAGMDNLLNGHDNRPGAFNLVTTSVTTEQTKVEDLNKKLKSNPSNYESIYSDASKAKLRLANLSKFLRVFCKSIGYELPNNFATVDELKEKLRNAQTAEEIKTLDKELRTRGLSTAELRDFADTQVNVAEENIADYDTQINNALESNDQSKVGDLQAQVDPYVVKRDIFTPYRDSLAAEIEKDKVAAEKAKKPSAPMAKVSPAPAAKSSPAPASSSASH